MIRRPPRSTLFPTRRSSDLKIMGLEFKIIAEALEKAKQARLHILDIMDQVRSEEHTSELQSRRDLVCRLLLEKKKQKINKELQSKPNETYHKMTRSYIQQLA